MQEGPPVIGLGFDFAVFWSIGHAVLTGTDPYAVWGSYYPPATSYAYGLFALLPVHVAFVLWTVACVAFLAMVVGVRRAPAWLLFAPITMAFAAGQVDLLFVALAVLLRRKGWQAVVAAALITLKPQLAAILLPWHLARWLRDDRGRLATWVGVSALLHLWPLLLDPGVFGRWLERMASLATPAAAKYAAAPGVWALYRGEGTLAFLLVGGLVFLGSLAFGEQAARAGALVGLPTAMYYDASALAGAAPATFIIPISWLALVLAHALGSFAPLAVVSAVTLVWLMPRPSLQAGRLVFRPMEATA